MNIIYTDYTLKHKSLDIFLAGCNGDPHCEGCHNPESWDFDIGTLYNEKYFKYIQKRVKEFDLLIDNIMIFGGEPLDQDIDELLHLLLDLKSTGKKIWLFTRYEIKEVSKEVVSLCDYIKCGRYIPELKTEENIQYGVTLPTNNQKIYKF